MFTSQQNQNITLIDVYVRVHGNHSLLVHAIM